MIREEICTFIQIASPSALSRFLLYNNQCRDFSHTDSLYMEPKSGASGQGRAAFPEADKSIASAHILFSFHSKNSNIRMILVCLLHI